MWFSPLPKLQAGQYVHIWNTDRNVVQNLPADLSTLDCDPKINLWVIAAQTACDFTQCSFSWVQMTQVKGRGIILSSSALLNMLDNSKFCCVCRCVWGGYLSWSCWTEIMHNAEQSALGSLPGELRLSFGTLVCVYVCVCVCLRAGSIRLFCAWDIVPNNGFREKAWSVCGVFVHLVFFFFKFMTFLCSVFLYLPVFLLSHGLHESGARGDEHAVRSVLRLPAERPLPRGS